MSNRNFRDVDLYELVYKITGDIDPVGESHKDSVRLSNLKEICHLVELLLGDIKEVSNEMDAIEYSRQVSGKFANKFIKSMIEEIE